MPPSAAAHARRRSIFLVGAEEPHAEGDRVHPPIPWGGQRERLSAPAPAVRQRVDSDLCPDEFSPLCSTPPPKLRQSEPPRVLDRTPKRKDSLFAPTSKRAQAQGTANNAVQNTAGASTTRPLITPLDLHRRQYPVPPPRPPKSPSRPASNPLPRKTIEQLDVLLAALSDPEATTDAPKPTKMDRHAIMRQYSTCTPDLPVEESRACSPDISAEENHVCSPDVPAEESRACTPHNSAEETAPLNPHKHARASAPPPPLSAKEKWIVFKHVNRAFFREHGRELASGRLKMGIVQFTETRSVLGKSVTANRSRIVWFTVECRHFGNLNLRAGKCPSPCLMELNMLLRVTPQAFEDVPVCFLRMWGYYDHVHMEKANKE